MNRLECAVQVFRVTSQLVLLLVVIFQVSGENLKLKCVKCAVQVFSQQRRMARGQIGCTAHLRKLQREDNGIFPSTLKVIAEGGSHPTSLFFLLENSFCSVFPPDRDASQGHVKISVVF